MLFTTAEHSTIVVTMIIALLVLEFGAVLLSVFLRSRFGFFTTLAAFSGTVGAVLLINAARDTAKHFWANIDPIFIEAPLAVCVLLAIPSFILWAVDGRGRDAKLKRLEVLEKAEAERNEKASKKTASKTAAPSTERTPSQSGTPTTEAAAKSKRSTSVRTETHAVA